MEEIERGLFASSLPLALAVLTARALSFPVTWITCCVNDGHVRAGHRTP